MTERHRNPREESAGLWHQPQMLNLVADILLLFALAAFSWSGWQWLKRLPLFPLATLTVATPLQRADAALIEDVARRSLAGNFFTVDLAAARAEFEKIPWVRRANLARQWPGELLLSLEEHIPVARWNGREDGEIRELVNSRGEVFAVPAHLGAESLPALAGPHRRDASRILQRHQQFAATLSPTGRHIAETRLTARGAWQLMTDDGILIELGRDELRLPIAARLNRLVEVFPALEARLGRPAAIDLRYANGFVVNVRGQPAAAPKRTSS